MFHHFHPYPPFVPENTRKLIVGTLPPPRFSAGLLKEGDVDFCYGSRDGQLWKILDTIFELNLEFASTALAIAQRKQFLRSKGIGIFDIVESAERQRMDAADTSMENVVLRDLLGGLRKFSSVDTLLFTGGNSKNAPEYFFRRQLKAHELSFVQVSEELPREHEFVLDGRTIRTVSLISPSGSANRAVGSIPEYKRKKQQNPDYTTFDYRVDQYSRYF
ncbi:uracil-DNA glycosylase family protein [Robertkochia solimangrovi]|uniref:uracil-DNA glycosylase family protein n=1 Tax=Robertkochia solimangrovi TaxID=2213046 RepID=UPI00117C7EB0|nr:uracil-DNA glycosylase family protein [Robertkochia solimangrovi]TRZ41466.1 uracil-DNA glycosylase family protein [Robertkochia solimangrovi]